MTDYTRYEYDDSVQRMTDKLSAKDGWGDGYDSSMGQVLIQLVADTTDHLHYMLERRTTESYMFTARTRSAVLQKASERGYHYQRVLGNRGFIQVLITTAASANIIIPKFSVFTLEDITYVSTSEVFIPTGLSEVLVPVVQGSLINQTITQSDLDADGDFIIEKDFDYIDENAILLVSDSFELSPVWKSTKRAMSFVSATDNFYDVRYGYDGMRFIFGDGKFGRQPQGNIQLTYVKVNPDDQPINSLNNEFEFGFDLLDVNGNTYTGTARNQTRIYNKQEPESNDSIKKNAALEHNSSARAVSGEDNVYWILNSGIGEIIDARVTGENEVNTYVYNTNNIYLNYVKAGNVDLNATEKQELRDYLKNLAIVNPHYVIQKAEELLLSVGLSVKKDRLLDISLADYYQLLKLFLEDYFSIKRGAIGARYEHSDIIRDLYKLEVVRNNITYKLVDFLRLDIDLLYPFSVPVSNKEVLVRLSNETPKINGTVFSLDVGGIICSVPIFSTDDNLDILYRMRDYVFANTPYLADVVIGNTNGQVQEIYNAVVGGGMLAGVNVPMNSNQYMMGGFTVGSNVGTTLVDSPLYNLVHTYYVGHDSSAGRRPIIPLFNGTTVSFTAPSDTTVLVYVRDNLNNSATETLYFTVSAGANFTDTFENKHSIQLEYVSNSNQQMTVSFNYPLVDSSLNNGLRIFTRDGYGSFTISKELGDIAPFVSILRRRKVPVNMTESGVTILQESLTIVDENNNLLYRATPTGLLISGVNVASVDGRVDYISGTVTIPSELPDGDYYIKFKQDKYQNVSLNERTIAVMLPISNSITAPNPFSFIEVI